MNNPQPQQNTQETLQMKLKKALALGNSPLLEAITQNSQRLKTLEAALRDMSVNLGAFLSELKNILDGKNAGDKSSGLEKQLLLLTTALNTFNREQEQRAKSQVQLLDSMNRLSALLEADSQAPGGHSTSAENL